MKKKLPLLLLVSVIMFSSCEKEPILIPVVPEIELLNIGPSTVVAHQDSIGFQIRYTDGDGDLGTNDDTERNIFVIDNRISATHAFRLQQLAPNGAEIPITGTFRFSLPNTIITDGSQEQTVTFTIYLVDRAGHESNRIESPVIKIIE